LEISVIGIWFLSIISSTNLSVSNGLFSYSEFGICMYSISQNGKIREVEEIYFLLNLEVKYRTCVNLKLLSREIFKINFWV
jgi:hypothetical protein